jgi:hypothetical protein
VDEAVPIEAMVRATAARIGLPRYAAAISDSPQIISGRAACQQHEWSNDELQALASIYRTSEETVLRRFLTFDLTSPAFYQRKRAECLARYAKLEQQQREEAANDDFKRNRPQEVPK